MSVNLKAIREEHARHSASQKTGELTLAQIRAHSDRAALLALVDELVDAIHYAADAHEFDCATRFSEGSHDPKLCTCGLADLLWKVGCGA